jgi:hypothetical protein
MTAIATFQTGTGSKGNGIEINFTCKPSEQIRKAMKEVGYRWGGKQRPNIWWAILTEQSKVIAEQVTNTIEEVKTIVNKSTKENFNLWNACQYTQLEGINRDADCKEIAKEIRTHIRKRFPQCKFSVTVPYYGKINFDIKSSPYEKDSKYLEAILNYCKSLLNDYKKCYSPADPYTDYAGVHNFYGWAEISWQYEQTEVTEQIKNEMADFDIKLAEFEKAEQERKEAEYQKYLKQEEIRNAEYNKRMEEEKKQIENIYNSVEVKELEDNNQYFIIGSEFAHLNKNNTLDQYKEEVASGKFELNNVKITKEIHFNNEEALTNFSNMLLNDFSFLENTGGSYTDDNRVNSMTDFYNMEKEDKNTVTWNLYGVAIYFNNQLQFVVDCQGYSYARYVGLTDNAITQKVLFTDQTINESELNELKALADQLEDISCSVITELDILKTWNNDNWTEYKELMKNKLTQYNFKLTKSIIQQLEIEELKTAMYKLLIEVDGIQDQFKKADIQQGDKLTLFYIGGMGSIMTDRITFDSVTNTTYAQYNNAVKLTFTPERKRNLHYNYFHSELLVFKGWHNLSDEVLNNVEVKNGYVITKSKYHSCDHKQYDEILSYFDSKGIRPIVNTYKPIF